MTTKRHASTYCGAGAKNSEEITLTPSIIYLSIGKRIEAGRPNAGTDGEASDNVIG